MYGLHAMALIFFGVANLVAYRLCKTSSHTRIITLRILCLLLLIGNLARYAVINPFVRNVRTIPVEFSTVAYFVVPIILLCNWKKSMSWASYSGLMAGFFNYMAMMTLGGQIYGASPPYDVYISMLCHGTLYICGFVTIGTHPCTSQDGKKLLAGVAFVALRALILRPYANAQGRTFIYELLDGNLVKRWCPPDLCQIMLPVYYIVLTAGVLLSIRAFFAGNSRLYRRFTQKSSQNI